MQCSLLIPVKFLTIKFIQLGKECQIKRTGSPPGIWLQIWNTVLFSAHLNTSFFYCCKTKLPTRTVYNTVCYRWMKLSVFLANKCNYLPGSFYLKTPLSNIMVRGELNLAKATCFPSHSPASLPALLRQAPLTLLVCPGDLSASTALCIQFSTLLLYWACRLDQTEQHPISAGSDAISMKCILSKKEPVRSMRNHVEIPVMPFTFLKFIAVVYLLLLTRSASHDLQNCLIMCKLFVLPLLLLLLFEVVAFVVHD